MKKSSIKTQEDRLDRMFSRLVRLLADGKCEKCGEYVGYSELDNAHYHSRKMRTVRWDFRNTAALCGTCHSKFDDHPNRKTDWFRKRLSPESDGELDILAHMTIKEHPIDRDKIEVNFKESLKELEG